MANQRFLGGIGPGATIKILPTKGKASKTIPIENLEPGNYLESAFDRKYWFVNEASSNKRVRNAFQIYLENGSELLVAEGTWLCGLYGPFAPCDRLTGEYCTVNLDFYGGQGRRRFGIDYHYPRDGSVQSPLAALFSKKLAHGKRKSFYFYPELISFLNKIKAAHPQTPIIWGTEISHPETGYAFSGESYHRFFCPLVPVKSFDNDEEWFDLAYVAVVNPRSFTRLTYSRVVEITKTKTSGPWFFPVFDSYRQIEETSTQRRNKAYNGFTFLVNGIPLAMPNALMDETGAELTVPREGEQAFPPQPPREWRGSFTGIWHDLPDGDPTSDTDELLKSFIASLTSAKAVFNTEDAFLSQVDSMINKSSNETIDDENCS